VNDASLVNVPKLIKTIGLQCKHTEFYIMLSDVHCAISTCTLPTSAF